VKSLKAASRTLLPTLWFQLAQLSPNAKTVPLCVSTTLRQAVRSNSQESQLSSKNSTPMVQLKLLCTFILTSCHILEVFTPKLGVHISEGTLSRSLAGELRTESITGSSRTPGEAHGERLDMLELLSDKSALNPKDMLDLPI